MAEKFISLLQGLAFGAVLYFAVVFIVCRILALGSRHNIEDPEPASPKTPPSSPPPTKEDPGGNNVPNSVL